MDIKRLVGTVAHESHHLGMRSDPPAKLSPAEELAFRVITLCIAEGVATEFISGPPPGRVPALPDLPFHIFTTDFKKAWDEHVANEGEIVKHQMTLLDEALSGKLTSEQLDQDMRDYWLNGSVGRAYVLGSEMFGAIFLAFGKEGVFQALKDPRRLFEPYNKALDTNADVLKRCVRVPDKSVQQALGIGATAAVTQDDSEVRKPSLNVKPTWDDLRSDNRFIDLVRRVGL